MTEQVDSLSQVVNGGDRALKVCSIVGVGGVGKSTLALSVLGRLKDHFQCRAVVAVSQEFHPIKDLEILMGRIQKQFGYEVSTVTSFAQHLADKRYLVVIDDLWTTSAWDAIKERLSGINQLGSRIIVTTRIENVATACSTPSDDGMYIHRVNLLSYADSRTLFVTKVFGQPPVTAQNDPNAPPEAQNDGCPEELLADMKIILEKCGGLPLAIVCIANVLARYNSPSSQEMWRRVCNSVGSQLETDPALEAMMQIIALSYNHLPHRLKGCAMLLSIFPEDYQIPKRRLLRRWICEGLIPEKRGLTLLDVAEAYYEELMSRNMIQQGLGEDGTASEGHCRVHDMMLEVIVSKSLDANFVSLLGSPRGWTSYDAVRRLCIHSGAGHGVDEMDMQHVRSLTTFGNKINSPGKLLRQLAKFGLLRVLDLEDCKDVKNHHMKQVCQLFLLRFLNLNETDITVMPSAISNLQQLEILWLYDTLLKKVPRSVVNLKKLEHMSFRNRRNHKIHLKLPRGLKKMKSLQEISRLRIGKNDVKLAKEIGDLVQLRELEVFVVWGRSEKVKRALESSVAKLKLCSLRVEEDIEYEQDPALQARAQ